MRPDHPKARVALDEAVARVDQLAVRRKVAAAVHVPLGVGAVVAVVRVGGVQRLPAGQRLADVEEQGDLLALEKAEDRLEDGVVDHHKAAVGPPHLHADVLPDLAGDGSRGDVAPQPFDRPVGVVGIVEAGQVEGRAPGEQAGSRAVQAPVPRCLVPPAPVGVVGNADVEGLDLEALEERAALGVTGVEVDVGVYHGARMNQDRPSRKPRTASRGRARCPHPFRERRNSV